MSIKILYFLILLLYSCDINREAIPVSNLNQDNLKYQKLLLNNSLSDTVMNINEIGSSSLLYTGSLNDSDTYTVYFHLIVKFLINMIYAIQIVCRLKNHILY